MATKHWSYRYRGQGPSVATKEVEESYLHCAQLIRDLGRNSWVFNKDNKNDSLLEYCSKMILAHLKKKDRPVDNPAITPYSLEYNVVENVDPRIEPIGN